MSTAYFTHPDCLLHVPDDGHPESPERLRAIRRALESSGLWSQLRHVEAPLATLDQIARVHTKDHIETVEAASPDQGYVNVSFDASMNPHTWQAVLRAAGAGIQAVDMVMFEEIDNAFCAIRPPGHHAERDLSMGFCIFNNVAIAAAHALAEYGLERVAIIDLDVHHGNGTEAIFRRNPKVMVCSLFEHPLYPMCGATSSTQRIINVPLPAGTDGLAYRRAFSETCLPWLDDFKPEFVFISAGFNAHREDEMAHFALEEGDYAWLTRQIVDLARRHARGRLVSILEGGYNTDSLARSVVAHIGRLMECQQ